MATKRGIRMRNWDTSHLKVHTQFVCFMYLMRFLSLVRRPYFQIFSVAHKYVEKTGELRGEAFFAHDYMAGVCTCIELTIFTQSALFPGKGRQNCKFNLCSLLFFLYRVAIWWILGA